MKKNLIVTIMFGSDPSFYFAKKSFVDYAKKVDADFLCITEYSGDFESLSKSNMLHEALFEKISLGRFLKKYQRVLYIDGDILITPHAKNIFNEYPNLDEVYMLNEGLLSDRKEELRLIASRINKPINDRNYFNAGVILFSSGTKFLQTVLIKDLQFFYNSSHWFDQTYINYICRVNELNVISLNGNFNRMALVGSPDTRFSADFIHYAGNGYCSKKTRPKLMFNDYCALYNYKPKLKERLIYIYGYILLRVKRLLAKI